MKLKLVLLLLVFAGLVFGQNLVPNPGFDDLVNCPEERGQIQFASSWSSATINSLYYPDLFNICSSNDQLSPPTSGHYVDSYQQPLSGGGYAGIYVWRNDNVNINGYIETPLTETMEQSKIYYIRFYVSPDLTSSQLWRYSDAVGLALTDTFYYQDISGNEILSLSPVVENRGELITDTIGWTEVSGCYLAQGGEKYAIIGNFRTDAETMAVVEDPNIQPYYTYLYIEDVLIQPFDPLPDTLLLCDGMPEQLDARFLDATYQWSTGATDSIITVSESGCYTIEAFMGGCTLQDTVVVLDSRDTRAFPPDTLVCDDVTLTFPAPLPGTYEWSDGSRGSVISVAAPGTYSVSVTNPCGVSVFTSDVEMENCSCNVYVPSAFSPNGDGINDHLEIYFGCDFGYEVKGFRVFDRWGGQAYSALAGNEVRWDGTAHGKSLPNGEYVWILEYDIIHGGLPVRQVEKGGVAIMR